MNELGLDLRFPAGRAHPRGAALMTGLWILLACPAAQAQSPDDRYVQAYSLLEEADKLKDSGQAPAAVTKYLEAQVTLKGLQQAHPEWNSKLVVFRLEYIANKLEPLTRASMPKPPAGARETAPSLNEQLHGMQEDIERLTARNTLLQAKLREALTVQPSAVDPRELAKAEIRIKQLQKERDLLAATLDQTGSKPGAEPANLKHDLVTQSAVASVLQKQNEELLRQIGELTTRLKGSARAAPGADSLALRETIAALEASNRVMKEEQTAMESRLKEFVRQHGPATTQRQAELEQQLAEARETAKTVQKERDGLIEKLNAVSRELNQRDARVPAPGSQELERQLDAIRARLQIFEAKSIPYTAEELALFKHAPIKVAAAQTNLPPAQNPVSAAGNDALLAAAAHDVDTGHYAEAEQKYQQAVGQDPKNVLLLARLAAVLMDEEKIADAEAALKQALQIDPQNSTALYLLGGVKLREENYEEALAALSLSAKIDPDRAQTQYFLGQALIQKGSRGPAESALRKALQLKPGWGDAHYLLAVLYATQEPNFRELAQYHYHRAIAGGVARNIDLEKLFHQTEAKP